MPFEAGQADERDISQSFLAVVWTGSASKLPINNDIGEEGV